MDVFQGEDHVGSSLTDLEAFRGELLEFVDIRSTGSPEPVGRFLQRQRYSAGPWRSGARPVSRFVLNHLETQFFFFQSFLSLFFFFDFLNCF